MRSVSAELCALPSAAIIVFRNISIVCYESWGELSSREIVRNFATRGAFLSLFATVPVSPLPSFPPFFRPLSLIIRVARCFVACITGSMQPRRDFAAWSSRVFIALRSGSSDVHHIRDRLEELCRQGVRRKAPKLPRSGAGGRGEGGGGGPTTSRGLERATSRGYGLTGHGRPQQNVSLSFSSLSLTSLLCERQTLPKKTC